MHMPAPSAGTRKRIAVFYQSTVMTNTQVLLSSTQWADMRSFRAGYGCEKLSINLTVPLKLIVITSTLTAHTFKKI